jgi:heat shock protein HtpX
MGEDGFAAQMAGNRRRSVAILAAAAAPLVLLVAVVWILVPLVVGVVVLAALGVVVALAYPRIRSTASLLAAVGARPADEPGHSRLHNLVEGLCAAAGLPKPAVYVVDDEAPNALALGTGPKTASLVVTTGLLAKLDRMELEGVVAHELSHIKSGDIEVSTLAANLFGRFAPDLAARLSSPRRELLADVNSISLTRYPPGLTAALEKLRADPARPTAGGRAVAHLWIETPDPPLEERIAALREL